MGTSVQNARLSSSRATVPPRRELPLASPVPLRATNRIPTALPRSPISGMSSMPAFAMDVTLACAATRTNGSRYETWLNTPTHFSFDRTTRLRGGVQRRQKRS
eukprot:619-Pelagococcus_subviridis.AAC.1